MPLFELLDGIRICVQMRDHNPPHFHAYHAEHEVLVKIKTLEILEGDLPGKQWKKLRTWAAANQSALLTEFHRLNPDLR